MPGRIREKNTKTVAMATSDKPQTEISNQRGKKVKEGGGNRGRCEGDKKVSEEGDTSRREEDGVERVKRSRSEKRKVRSKKKASSAEAQRMRSRIIQLTGSDTIKVNDKDYMEKLRAKIWQEHEAELKRKELEREDNERQRMRRLLARGIIEPEQLREDRVLWREYKTRSNLYDKAYRGKRRKSSPRKDPADVSARAKSAPQSRQQGKRVSLCLPPTEVSSARAYGDSGSLSPHHYNHGRPATSFARYSDTYEVSGDMRQVSFSRHTMTPTRSVSAASSRSVQTPEPREKRLFHRTTPTPNNNNNSNNKQKYEPPIIREMRREETVAGLYRLAEIACINEL